MAQRKQKPKENNKKEIIEIRQLKISKISLIFNIITTVFLIILTILFGIQQLPEKTDIKFREVSRSFTSGTAVIDSCKTYDCTYRYDLNKQSYVDINGDSKYIHNFIAISNEGKATTDLGIAMSCNFYIVAISEIYSHENQNIEIKSIQADNYKTLIEIDKLSLTDLTFLEIFQEGDLGDVVNPQCNFVYTSGDNSKKEYDLLFSDIPRNS